jgi:TerC family integral membrane protein
MLLLDLGVFHRKSERVSVRAALGWTAFWIALSMAFNAWIWTEFGQEKGLEFLAGYILEKSLSVDNLFVFLLIFSYFKVPPELQHRVLFFGILGALLLRGVFIYLGATLVHQFHWILYVFGAFLVFSGFKLLFLEDDDEQNPENAIVRAIRARIKLSNGFRGDKFFVVENGVRLATPLFLVLVAVETSDVLFAVDSIPAIFGVTDDTFIVYTSNVMAILGLRALYFALAGLLEYFHYLNYGLAVVLIFIGAKMLGEKYVDMSIAVELGIIGAILIAAVLASVLFPKKIPDESELEES